MDILLGKFVNKYVQNLNNKDLIELYNFLKLEDEIIYKFYLTGKIGQILNQKNIKFIQKF